MIRLHRAHHSFSQNVEGLLLHNLCFSSCSNNVFIFVSDKKRQLLFAVNFKVGASTLIRSIPNSSGLVPPNEVAGLKYVDLSTRDKLEKYGLIEVSVTQDGALTSYQQYFKFMFVRNPYTRLLSAFRDKFRNKDIPPSYKVWYDQTVNDIIKKYRTDSGATLNLKLTRTVITFEEFLKFVIDDNKNIGSERHWTPLSSLCMPCVVNYTFIGKFETFADDFRYLMSRISVVKVPESRYHSSPGDSTSNVFKRYWREIPLPIVRQISDLYTRDFEMFGYKKDLTYYL